MNGTTEIGAVELFVRVAELEIALRTRLFHRTTRHVELMSAHAAAGGRLLTVHCTPVDRCPAVR